MKRLYLIRHALPEFPGNVHRCIGSTDLPLGQTGLAQAADMAQRLPPVTAVFSSPLLRSVQTAQAISPDIALLEGLRELDYGAWDGLSFSEIRRRYPELYAARGSAPNLPPPGAEPEEQGLARFRAALEAAAQNSPGDFAAVTHAGITAVFLQAIAAGRRKPEYCEIIPLIWENSRFYPQEESI